MKISVIGLGPVGLVTSACLAHRGFYVVGLDIDEERTLALSRAEVPFYEPELDVLVSNGMSSGNLSFTNDYPTAVHESDISLICVGTPPLDSGTADLKPLESALKSLGKALRHRDRYHVVAIKSTMPPGTTEKLARETLETSSSLQVGDGFGLCCNPEFLREGSSVRDMMNADRVVIGSVDEASGERLEEMWKKFYQEPGPPILRTTPINAELIKHTSNSFLAMKISFINMTANLCQRIPGADVQDIARGIGLDHRIGSHFLRAGLGFGGSCFGRDLRTFAQYAERLGIDLGLVRETIRINEQQPIKAIDLARVHLGNLKGKRLAILGLAFKPGTDDVREAVSQRIIDALLQEGAEVVAYDPKASENVRKVFGRTIKYSSSSKECISDSDCCIVVTEWEEFKELKPEDFAGLMRTPVVIDGRRVYDWRSFKGKSSFSAVGLGPTRTGD